MVSVHDDPIELVPSRYEAWRERFTAERDRITAVLANATLDTAVERIEHVGSTAVPALDAKDIVDLDVVVDDDAVRDVSETLERELGGDRLENTEGWHPVFRDHDGRRFNDHVFAASGEKWKVSVVTRDVLRARSDLRDEYEALKRDLAAEHDDVVSYSEGKSEFLARVLDVARTEDEFSFEFTVPSLS